MNLAPSLPSHDTARYLDVPFLDLRVEDGSRGQYLTAFENVLRHGRLINGPEVRKFEEAFAARCNRTYGIGVGSGMDALVLALRALHIGKGDEVIVPALSFVATANAVRMVGAEPIFCDIADDLNIDVNQIEDHITPRTKVIMPVHWAGRVCDMSTIINIADRRGQYVVADASQSFGALVSGYPQGAWGDMACFSMNPMKTLAALGEAGMIVTNDKEIYERLDPLRYQGVWNKEFCHELSGNHRLDTIHAAMLLVRLDRVDDVLRKRREIAAFYDKHLAGIVEVPPQAPYEKLAYYTYTIQCDRRAELKAHLQACGIETKIQHPVLMPNQPLYKSTAKGCWINAERLMKRVLCIPCHEKMTDAQVWHVVNSIKDFYK
jgi:dTDP-4-amino-4,6-dideoxygalactose transaminase